MDTRIIMDYVRRWAWLWVLVVGICLLGGFAPVDDVSYLLVMPLIYLVIPMSTEFRKQGPMWIHRTLPVTDRVLCRTGWFVMVVLPVVAVVASLLPALLFGLLTGRSNLAVDNVLPLVTGGLLWTSVCFSLITLGSHGPAIRWVHGVIQVSTGLIAGTIILLLMKSGSYWEIPSFRLGAILGAILLVPVSYMIAPNVLQIMVRKHDEETSSRPGEARSMYAISLADRILSVPFGRTLLTGLWLLAFLFWMNLFYVLLSGSSEWWDLGAFLDMAPVGVQMVAMFLFLYSFAHVNSLRGTAVLPMSPIRRTFTVVILPVAAAIPIVTAMTAQALFLNVDGADGFRLVVMMLYCLVTAYAALAVCLRFGFVASFVALFTCGFALMLRIMLAGKHGMLELNILDLVVGLTVIGLAILWIHQAMDRHPNIYRRHWIPSGLRRA